MSALNTSGGTEGAVGMWEPARGEEVVLQLDAAMSVLIALIRQIKILPFVCHEGNSENGGEAGVGLPSLTVSLHPTSKAQRNGDRDNMVFFSTNASSQFPTHQAQRGESLKQILAQKLCLHLGDTSSLPSGSGIDRPTGSRRFS